MRKTILSLIICYLFCFNTISQSFRVDFITAINEKDMAKAEAILKAWDLADSNDPDLYIAYFNFYTVKSMEAPVSVISSYDMKYSKQALDFISEGIERFPTRFDMRIAKLYMLRELKKYPDYIAEIKEMIVYSKKIENSWKGEDYTTLPYAEDMFFGAVLDCQEFLFSKKDASLYKNILQISDEMLKYYPNHVQSLLSCSTVYIAQNEYDKALEALQKATVKEPSNAILLYNIGYVYYMKGDRENAKKYFELTVTHSNDQIEHVKEAAKRRLEELK